jgi:hypothetical protein
VHGSFRNSPSAAHYGGAGGGRLRSPVRPPTRPLRPVMTDITRFLRITATAGTKLVEAYFSGGSIISPGVRMAHWGGRRRGGRSARLVYDPKAFFLRHPRTGLDQAVAHCPKFLTAAPGCAARLDSAVVVRSRKPTWDDGHGPPLPDPSTVIPGGCDLRWPMPFAHGPPPAKGGVRLGGGHRPRFHRVFGSIPGRRVACSPPTHPYATPPGGGRGPGAPALPRRGVRLACVRPSTRDHPEPGSNSVFCKGSGGPPRALHRTLKFLRCRWGREQPDPGPPTAALPRCGWGAGAAEGLPRGIR